MSALTYSTREIFFKIFKVILFISLMFTCKTCLFEYKSLSGLNKHINKSHNKIPKEDKLKCTYCGNEFSHRQSKWRHEKTCGNKNNLSIDEKFKQLSDEIKELKEQKLKPQNITNNITNNTNNIQYIINPIGKETIGHLLSIEKQREIMQKGLNSLTFLIEHINFDESVPENHSYCVTALNDKHASVINPNTNSIIKTDKNELFDKIMNSNLTKLEKMAQNPSFKKEEKTEYNQKIKALKEQLIMNKKSQKKYYQEVNLLSFNNKDLVLNTWASLKNLENLDLVNSSLNENSENKAQITTKIKEQAKPKTSKLIPDIDSSDSELSEDSDDQESDDDEPSPVEIKIKNKTYIMEGTNIYSMLSSGAKGEFQGIYSNGKIKKSQLKEKEIDL